MVAAVHVLAPGDRAGDWTALRHRVRPQTMAAEGVLHDLGVIAMLSSDSQGMGRIGEVYRRALQNADAMKAVRGAEAGPGDNERVLRHLAKVTINPAITHGARSACRLARGRQARRRGAVVAAVRRRAARAGAQERDPGLGRLGRRQRHDDAGRAGAGAPAGRRRGRARRRGCRSPSWPVPRWTPSCRRRDRARRWRHCRELTAADMVRNSRTGDVASTRAATP